jgi:oligosaccharide repeat unit polymerase
MFSLGVFAFSDRANQRQVVPPNLMGSGFEANPILRRIIVYLPIVGLPFMYQRALQIAALTPITDSTYVNLRFALTEEGMGHSSVSFGLIGYVVPVCYAAVLVELVCSRRTWFERRGWTVFVVSLAYGVISTGRTYFLLVLLSVTGVIITYGRARVARLAPTAFAALLLVYFAIGSALDKLSLGNSLGDDSLAGALQTFSVYMLGGVTAFDQVSGTVDMWALSGENTFRTFFAVLSSMGFNVEVVRKVKEYIFIPEPTNVYSVFYPYANDFGLIGAVLMMFVLGAMHGVLRRGALRGDPRFVILNGFALYPLAMQFFQDQYVSLLTIWIILLAIVFAVIRPIPEAKL